MYNVNITYIITSRVSPIVTGIIMGLMSSRAADTTITKTATNFSEDNSGW